MKQANVTAHEASVSPRDDAASLTAPVLFVVFNRPDKTAVVFDAIRRARPSQLFIACDGPREEKPAERELVDNVKSVVADVDWDCEVRHLYRENNQGCKRAVSGAITWFFEHVDQGIILEDDCLPSESFFSYCSELLDVYKHDNRIWHISGCVVMPISKSTASYHFSVNPGIWGWATWRDRWSHYDSTLKAFEDNRAFRKIAPKTVSVSYWKSLFSEVKLGRIDTWDYQWIYTMWAQGGMAITPNTNLIKNIGFDASATHTRNAESELADLASGEIYRISHPASIIQDYSADRALMKKYFSKKNVLQRIRNRLMRGFN